MANTTNIYRMPIIILALAVLIVALAVKYVDFRFNEFKSAIAPATLVRRELTAPEINEINRLATERMGVKPLPTAEKLARIQAIMEENARSVPPLTDARRAEIERVMNQANF